MRWSASEVLLRRMIASCIDENVEQEHSSKILYGVR